MLALHGSSLLQDSVTGFPAVCCFSDNPARSGPAFSTRFPRAQVTRGSFVRLVLCQMAFNRPAQLLRFPVFSVPGHPGTWSSPIRLLSVVHWQSGYWPPGAQALPALMPSQGLAGHSWNESWPRSRPSKLHPTPVSSCDTMVPPFLLDSSKALLYAMLSTPHTCKGGPCPPIIPCPDYFLYLLNFCNHLQPTSSESLLRIGHCIEMCQQCHLAVSAFCPYNTMGTIQQGRR